MYGIDYWQTLAPVVKVTTIRSLLSIAAVYDYECEHKDFVTAFLNEDLDEIIYMEIPEGLQTENNKGMVCKIR